MPVACVHPGPDDVGQLLAQLFGKRVAAKKSAPFKSPAVVSTYVGADGLLAAMCVFDLESANYAGAALPMMPRSVAIEAIANRKLAPDVLDNLREVSNIMTRLLNGSSSRVKLTDVFKAPPPPLPPAVCTLMARPVRRVDLELEIGGYGSGRIALLFAAPPIPG